MRPMTRTFNGPLTVLGWSALERDCIREVPWEWSNPSMKMPRAEVVRLVAWTWTGNCDVELFLSDRYALIVPPARCFRALEELREWIGHVSCVHFPSVVDSN